MQIYSKARPFGADKILFKKHFQSKRVSQSHLCRILFNPAAQIVLIGEARNRLACWKRGLINWLLTDSFSSFKTGMKESEHLPSESAEEKLTMLQKSVNKSGCTKPFHQAVMTLWCFFCCQGTVGDFCIDPRTPDGESLWMLLNSKRL